MPSTPILSVAQLKLFADQDRSTLLATSPEDQWLERKSGQVQSRDVANVMIGMANAEGGIVVIGVTDAGVIEGVAAGDQNAWRRASPDFTVPPVRHGRACGIVPKRPSWILAAGHCATVHFHESVVWAAV